MFSIFPKSTNRKMYRTIRTERTMKKIKHYAEQDEKRADNSLKRRETNHISNKKCAWRNFSQKDKKQW